jgi:hypothetical protein
MFGDRGRVGAGVVGHQVADGAEVVRQREVRCAGAGEAGDLLVA